MEIVVLFWGAAMLLAGAVLVAILWVTIRQLAKISRVNREARTRARKAQETEELENSIRLDLLSKGFSDSEVRDAIRSSRVWGSTKHESFDADA